MPRSIADRHAVIAPASRDLRQGERELVTRLQSGDEEAFVILVEAHQAQMLRVALSFVGSRAVAEEVVQDAWVGVVRGIERFQGQSSLRTWLFHIVVNRARTTGVRERNQHGPDVHGPLEDPARFDADGGWASPLPHWSEEIDDRLSAPSRIAEVHRGIAHLPAALRQVVTLRDVEGLSSAEVCSLLQVSEGHQRVLLHRGRVAIRRMLESREREGER